MTGILRKLNWLIGIQAGFDLLKFARFMKNIPRFISDWLLFRKQYSGRMGFLPCLHDREEEGGVAKGDYFWQDLFVAQKIFKAQPSRHVDVGSRLDGFIAHVASFREIEVFDIRPITAAVTQVIFRQADITDAAKVTSDYCDSLSCLHALEHFGLGRYGDRIDPEGHVVGLKNMARLIKTGGIFYLSVPVGVERVEFNAHRIFNPIKLVRLAGEVGLELDSFASYRIGESLRVSNNPAVTMAELAMHDYALGIFIFIKK